LIGRVYKKIKIKMRTVRSEGELVVQQRSCRLVVPFGAGQEHADGHARLLREDDTIVEDFTMSQVLFSPQPKLSRHSISAVADIEDATF
jgi:hypothetical protein